MRLFTSRWANRSLAHLRCVPTGISRGTPRFPTGYKYRLVRELAPGDTAWNAPDWESFEAAYVAQLEEIGIYAILARLERICREAGGAGVVLLCYEADASDCHRGILADWLRERGVTIEELQPGDLPQCEDATELKLF